jgi:hypothetical protein
MVGEAGADIDIEPDVYQAFQSTIELIERLDTSRVQSDGESVVPVTPDLYTTDVGKEKAVE